MQTPRYVVEIFISILLIVMLINIRDIDNSPTTLYF